MSSPSSEQSWVFMLVVGMRGPTLPQGGQEQVPLGDSHHLHHLHRQEHIRRQTQ